VTNTCLIVCLPTPTSRVPTMLGVRAKCGMTMISICRGSCRRASSWMRAAARAIFCTKPGNVRTLVGSAGLTRRNGMLKRARRRDDIEWVLGDLASAMFARVFDLIVMIGHAFQTIVADEGIRRSIASVRRALVAGGRFA
jgi:hypothetical protein